jgi:hypothetical protein
MSWSWTLPAAASSPRCPTPSPPPRTATRSLAPGAQPLPGKQGDFDLGAPLPGPFLVGPVGAGGSLSLGFTVPNLGFGPNDALLIYEQAFVKPAAGPTLLSSPTTAVLVDASL